MQTIAAVTAGNATGLRFFFGFLLLLVLTAGAYIFRERKKFYGEEGDTHASANLRMWLVILV
ncbi:MAG: hypothetical protein ACR2NX_13145 [Chthoniobacterales bacterium]